MNFALYPLAVQAVGNIHLHHLDEDLTLEMNLGEEKEVDPGLADTTCEID
jgi:hypothetical protein